MWMFLCAATLYAGQPTEPASALLIDRSEEGLLPSFRQVERQRRNILKQLEDTQTPELFTRLGHVEFSAGRLLFLEEVVAFERDYAEALEAGEDTAQLEPDLSEVLTYQRAAVDAYMDAIRVGGTDEATYYLAMTLAEMSQPEEAAEQFKVLVDRWPVSGHRARAEVMLGEYHFDNNRAEEALAHYEVVAQMAHPMAEFATYKAAWCAYNLGDHPAAINYMTAVVDGARPQLAEEAKKDLMHFERASQEPN